MKRYAAGTFCRWELGRMLSEEKVAEIKRLLATGLSNRAIAKQVGVDRNTVNEIAKGNRPDYQQLRRKRRRRRRPLPRVPAYRCRGCHYVVVFKPCLICTIRHQFGREFRTGAKRSSGYGIEQLEITLERAERDRYKWVYAIRRFIGKRRLRKASSEVKKVADLFTLVECLVLKGGYIAVTCSAREDSGQAVPCETGTMGPIPESTASRLLPVIRLLWRYLRGLASATQPTNDEQGLRRRVHLTLTLLQDAAGLTQTEIHDELVETASRILRKEALLRLLLPVMGSLLNEARAKPGAEMAMSAVEPLSLQLAHECERQRIDPASLAVLIRILFEILRLFGNHRDE